LRMISSLESEKLDKDFYMKDAVSVAKNLLGKYLIKNTDEGYVGGMIVETEAYMGPKDDAAHSYNLKRTKRNEAMYEEGGVTYVYFIYGMYYCLNIVTNKPNIPQAVLIRAVEPKFGLNIMIGNRNTDLKNLTNGPAKLCRALDIDLSYNKVSLLSDKLFITQGEEVKNKIVSTKRINIEYARNYKDKPWRFIVKNSKFLSR